MDEESHSTSQDSSNSREVVTIQINGVPLHFVNHREVRCVICERVYSPANEANRQVLSICQNCEVRYNEVARRLNLEKAWPRVEWHLEGLPRVFITEEHKKKYNELECAICLDPLSVGSIVNQLPCLHFFHPLCIVPWLKVRMSCPTCRYKLSSRFRYEIRQNSNRRIGIPEIFHDGFNVNSSSTSSNINELEVVVSESHNGTTDSSIRDREGSRGGWFLFAAAPIVSLVGIALVECLQNLLGDGRGRGSTGHVEFLRQCQQQVRMFSSGSSSTRTSNLLRENT